MDEKEILVLVPPNITTDPCAPKELEMTNADLVLMWSESVSEIPTRLDINELRAAVSKTLAVYRPACGRMRKNSTGDWKILLTDSPIPLEIVECDNAPQLNDYVFQPPEKISSLLPHIRDGAPTGVINNDLPLVSLKVTLYAEKTMLGISWHHALGDGSTRFRFMSHLSRSYQGLAPLYPPPSFARIRFFDPASDHEDAKSGDDATGEMLRLVVDETQKGTSQAQNTDAKNDCKPNVAVHWIVPRNKAKILRENMQKCLGGSEKLSIHDCLSACVASAIHKSGHDIREIVYTFSFRGFYPGFDQPDIAGNVSASASVGKLEDTEACDPCRVALKIRQGIVASRTPDSIEKAMRAFEQIQYSCAGKGLDWCRMYREAHRNVLTINAMTSLTWQESVNFGYIGTKYYVADAPQLPFYTRIQTANPSAASSGSSSSSADAIEVSFTALRSLRSKILENLKLEENNYLLLINEVY